MAPDRVAIVRALEGRRSELEKELASLTAVPRDPMAAVSFGKRIGDGTTEAVDRLNNVGAANSIALTLVDVERALEKLADGTYGICDGCKRRSRMNGSRRSRGPRSASRARGGADPGNADSFSSESAPRFRLPTLVRRGSHASSR